MKIVPVIKSSDLQRSLHFCTELLDFERKWPGHEDREIAIGVVDLVRDCAELQLSRHSGDGVFGSVNRVFVDDVDEHYVTFRTRGLNTMQRPDSPIHTAPVDQTWGLREFAVIQMAAISVSVCPKDDRLIRHCHLKPRQVNERYGDLSPVAFELRDSLC